MRRLAFLLLPLILVFSCTQKKQEKLRGWVDTVGFVRFDWQMDSIMARIARQPDSCLIKNDKEDSPVLMAICPHDDYAYAGPLYRCVLSHVSAPVAILFGVSHKARLLGLQNRIVFDHYTTWRGPYGKVQVSPLRDEIVQQLDTSLYCISDSMASIEHSLEALVPFLQYYHRDLEIVPILVPYMDFDRMKKISKALAKAINDVTSTEAMEWGKDFALVISTDAVHYGDEDWNNKNYAPYGTDTSGYLQAVSHEKEIMDRCFNGKLSVKMIQKFYNYTVQDSDYHEYRWTWCGRYSVPLGLLTGHRLAAEEDITLKGMPAGYMNSIDHPQLPVKDLRMGTTAPANLHHWVGYAGALFFGQE